MLITELATIQHIMASIIWLDTTFMVMISMVSIIASMVLIMSLVIIHMDLDILQVMIPIVLIIPLVIRSLIMALITGLLTTCMMTIDSVISILLIMVLNMAYMMITMMTHTMSMKSKIHITPSFIFNQVATITMTRTTSTIMTSAINMHKLITVIIMLTIHLRKQVIIATVYHIMMLSLTV